MSLFTGDPTEEYFPKEGPFDFDGKQLKNVAAPTGHTGDVVTLGYLQRDYKLAYIIYWHFSSNGGAPSEPRPAWALPFAAVKRDSIMRIISHSFDNDGGVPDNVRVHFYLDYHDTAGVKQRKDLGTLTYAKSYRATNLKSVTLVNHDFNLGFFFTAGDLDPIAGYLSIDKPTDLTAGNESVVCVSVYNKGNQLT